MKKIVDTEFIKIIEEKSEYKPLIKLSDGGWVVHNSFPKDVRGLVAALDLATNVCSGKFYLKTMVCVDDKEIKQLE